MSGFLLREDSDWPAQFQKLPRVRLKISIIQLPVHLRGLISTFVVCRQDSMIPIVPENSDNVNIVTDLSL